MSLLFPQQSLAPVDLWRGIALLFFSRPLSIVIVFLKCDVRIMELTSLRLDIRALDYVPVRDACTVLFIHHLQLAGRDIEKRAEDGRTSNRAQENEIGLCRAYEL